MTPSQLRGILKKLGFTAREAAARLGVDERTVRRWLAGDSPIPTAAAVLLATWASNPQILASLQARGNVQP